MIRQNIRKTIDKMVFSEEYRFQIQTLISTAIFGILGSIMFLINIKTYTVDLAIITGSMGVVGLSLFLYIKRTKKILLPRVVLFIVFIVAIIRFIYTGGIEGFSPYWVVLLPYLAFFLYEYNVGVCLSIFTFAIIVTMLWTPISGMLEYQYASAFLMRFPILYLGCFGCAVATEYIKKYTFIKLKDTVKQLDELSKFDPLTKLENRRAFEAHLISLWHMFQNKDKCVTILIADIDNFKNYNDYYGHLQGDNALVEVAQIIKDVAESYQGYACRWGGEEFMCLLPFTDCIKAKKVADELVNAVYKAKIPHEKTILDEKVLTISVGGAVTDVSHNHSTEDVIKKADKSLYAAKYNGKNRSGLIAVLK